MDSDSYRNAVLALDIGATKLAVGIVRPDGSVVAEDRRPTPKMAASALDLLIGMGSVAARSAQAEGLDLVGVGIACGGPLDLEEGLVLSPPNLPDWRRVPISQLAFDAFRLPVFLQNDAAAGAIATYLWDNPEAVRDVVYITVSSGIGCGVIADGALLAGATGNGSELGHVPLIWDGRLCKCGQMGCVEAYVSGTSIGERFSEVRPMDTHRYTAQEVAALATAGDGEAAVFWGETMRMLRRVTRAAVDLFDPALVCLGGGVTDAGDELLAPAFSAGADGHSLSHKVGKPPTIRRTGFGRGSGVASAAAVAWNRIGAAGGRKVRIRECSR